MRPSSVPGSERGPSAVRRSHGLFADDGSDGRESVLDGGQWVCRQRDRVHGRPPLLTIVVVQAGIKEGIVFSQQNAGDGWANSWANLSDEDGVIRGFAEV